MSVCICSIMVEEAEEKDITTLRPTPMQVQDDEFEGKGNDV